MVDIVAIEFDRAFDARARDRVVHAIERAQESRFAAARRADESGHMLGMDVDRNFIDRLLVPVEYRNVGRADLGLARGIASGVGGQSLFGHHFFSNLLRR